jgi:hypothetical protein
MIPQQILNLMEDTKDDARKAAIAWFNKCDLQDLIDTKLCLVEMDRVESFLNYAKSKGVIPNGGAVTENMKSQYFYI